MSKSNEALATRREVLVGGVAVLASIAVPARAFAFSTPTASLTGSPSPDQGDLHMSYVTTKDGTQIFYKDWGKGPVVTFSHGWPLNADAWDPQLVFLVRQGFRVVAHDRRGHGRSTQTTTGNDMDTYADDLAALIEALDLKDATL